MGIIGLTGLIGSLVFDVFTGPSLAPPPAKKGRFLTLGWFFRV